MHRVSTDAKYNNKVYWYLNTNNKLEAVERFKLPAGISCDNGCMMQWWWVGKSHDPASVIVCICDNMA
jgi:hypothetical protein